ncbi:hypothetical protein [Streptomyces antibioticus]|uniref:hypothetical protein n=1 Tax=Streptomyces antibioticus TaxID=1890 RepID=UPI0036DCF0B7
MYRIESAIERVTALGSVHRNQLELYREEQEASFTLAEFVGVAEALRDVLKAGWTESAVELVYSDTHSEYLDKAGSLLDAGYKTPAAVIGGTALEFHVRALCVKHGVATERPDGSPKKSDTMNADLKRADVYSTLQHNHLTAWMDLRNKAPHGDWVEYDKQQVRMLIDGVHDFMLKYPA